MIESENIYGEKIKKYRQSLGMTQEEVAKELDVTPGYISNVENGRTAMSLRILIFFARLMNIPLDALVGDLENEYKDDALDNEISLLIHAMSIEKKEKLLKTLKIWKEE